MSGEKQHELYDRRRGRNMVVLFGLLGIVALIIGVTFLKLQVFAANPFSKQFKPQVEYLQEQTLEKREGADSAAENQGEAQ